MNILILDEASMELDDAFNYYQYQQANLGHRFIDSFLDTLELIKFYPNAWHPLSRRTRRCLIKGFPYGVIYQANDEKITIVAVANLHQKPNYWSNRIS